ncbi:MAG: RecQ family ATP-dependent DNA helicase [Desulfuromonadales bacterium]|nr:RecQ family ATP-dependent DNA helicase [Desulfuromonadales bacterium]
MTTIDQELQRSFGFNTFRDGQKEVMTRLLAGKSVLAVFPTGGGKSLCYQLPALLLDGLTVVISPLIALMKDQLDFLLNKGVPAARLDSTLTREENQQLFNDLHAGKLKLLYVSPERFGNERFLKSIARQRIALLAIDEAHCISEWGHNFRPDYLKIARLAKELKVERTLTLTATATPTVATDICAAFAVAEQDYIYTGFYRPNLQLSVRPVAQDDRREILLAQIKKRPPGSTIVYVTLQRTAEEIATYLGQNGFVATAYHAGLKSEERTAIQNSFMASNRAIIVATIAFGMGIDKADIRYVYHYNLPKGLESYSQEIGRAGRDGEPSVCELLASADDAITLENFSYGDTPEKETIDALVRRLLAAQEIFDISEQQLSGEFDLRPLVVKTLLTYLELEGYLVSTGQFYSEYKFQPLKPSTEIFARFSAERAEFLKSVFRHAKKGRTWFTLDTVAVSQEIDQPRDRIVAALGYLEEEGDMLINVAGIRQGYRRLKRPADLETLIDALHERFRKREENDLGRIEQTLAFAGQNGCLTQYLLAYFGEQHAACGHCSWCHGRKQAPLQPHPRPPFSTEDEERLHRLMTEKHAALRTLRQLTRFLCGLSSPATTQAKLRSHAMFAAYAAIPFKDVLQFVQKTRSVIER